MPTAQTTVDSRPAAPAGTGLSSPSLRWAVAIGTLLALMLVGSYPLQIFLDGLWETFFGHTLARHAAHAPLSATISALWSSALWTVAGLGVATTALRSLPAQRLATVAGLCAGTLVALAAMAASLHGHWPGVSLPLAALLGGITGRMAFEHWTALQAHRRTESKRQLQATIQQAKAEFLTQLSRDLRTPVHAVLGMADRLRDRIGSLMIRSATQASATLTASIGIALFDGHPDYQRMLDRAEEALREAKTAGRNRCAISA